MASVDSDSDLIDLLVGEQGRVNAALEQTDMNDTVSDILPLSGDVIGFTGESITVTPHTTRVYTYGNSGTRWGFFTYG